MGGGGSKEASKKNALHQLKTTNSFRGKSKQSVSSTFQFGLYSPDLTSKSVVVLHVRPGSNGVTTDWLKLDEESGEVTPNTSRKSKNIPILNRVSNGGGTVEDIVFLEDAATNIAAACAKARSLVLVVDVLTVEGQAVLKYLWKEHGWLKNSNSTIVLILPTFSSERAGMGTTHPSLYGPAWSPIQATYTLGIDFGSSFLTSKKKGSKPEAQGTRVAFVPRHTWYGSINPINLIVVSIVTRLNLRLKIRDEWEKKKCDATTETENISYDDVKAKLQSLRDTIQATKKRRAKLEDSVKNRQLDREVKKAAAAKAVEDTAKAAEDIVAAEKRKAEIAKKSEKKALEEKRQEAQQQVDAEKKAKDDWLREETEVNVAEKMVETSKELAEETTTVQHQQQQEQQSIEYGYDGEQTGPWTAHLDPDSNHIYYLNSITGESTWHRPSDYDVLAVIDPITALSSAETAKGVEEIRASEQTTTATTSAKVGNGGEQKEQKEQKEHKEQEESKVQTKTKKRRRKKKLKEGSQIGANELDEYAMSDDNEDWDEFAMSDDDGNDVDKFSMELNQDNSGGDLEGFTMGDSDLGGDGDNGGNGNGNNGNNDDQFLDDFGLDNGDSTNHLEADYDMAMSHPSPSGHSVLARSTTPENKLESKYQSVRVKERNAAVKNDDPDGSEKSIAAQWAEAALNYVRKSKKKSTKKVPSRPHCEIVFHAGSRPEHYASFLETSFERLVLHDNAFSSEATFVTQLDLELSVANLSTLWPSTWQYMYVEGEVGDVDQIASDDLSCTEAGAPNEFSKEYCKHLPLGDIGCWPSGGVILAAGGTKAAELISVVQNLTGKSEYDGHNSHVRQEIQCVQSLEELTSSDSWTSGASDCILVIDTEDSPDDAINFLKDQSAKKLEYKQKLLDGENPGDIPPSIVVALLLPQAAGNGKYWANAAQIFAVDSIHPGATDLIVLMQNGLSDKTAACLNIMIRCPVDLSAVCKHMSPFPKIHHAVGFVATCEGATGKGEVGCLIDTAGLTGQTEIEEEETQDMSVYVSYSIYSGPGGYKEGFCVEGDEPDSPKSIIAQIIGTSHRLSPVANAGYGISSVSALPEEANSVWGVLATIPSIMEDVLMRALQAADNVWNTGKMEEELNALAELRSSYITTFPPPEDVKDAEGFASSSKKRF